MYAARCGLRPIPVARPYTHTSFAPFQAGHSYPSGQTGDLCTGVSSSRAPRGQVWISPFDLFGTFHCIFYPALLPSDRPIIRFPCWHLRSEVATEGLRKSNYDHGLQGFLRAALRTESGCKREGSVGQSGW